MSELSFLIDLLLNHKLGKDTKTLIAGRIKELGNIKAGPIEMAPIMPMIPGQDQQAASTIAAMARHAQQSLPPIAIAQTPAANAAMETRNKAIADAISGKINKEAGHPRKF